MRNYITILAVILCLCSCVEEEFDGNTAGTNSHVSITAELLSTKVSFEENEEHSLCGKWNIEDELVGFTGKGDKLRFEVVSIDADSGRAKLELTCSTSLGAGDEVHAVYFPGLSMEKMDAAGIVIDFSHQTAEDIPALMVADGVVTEENTLNLIFRNCVSILGIVNPRITVSESGRTIKTAIVSGHELVSTGTVSLVEGALTFIPGIPADFIYKNIDAAVTDAGSLENPIYIAVPASPVAKVSVLDNRGTLYTYEVGRTATAGKFCRMDSKTFNVLQQPANSNFTVGGVTWAKYNLGGTATTGAASWGDLYRWGDDSIIYTEKSSSGIVFDSSHQAGYDLYAGECYWNGSMYTKYTETDGKTVLDPVDDPVQLAYPGTGWRLPTMEEFNVLASLTSGEDYTVTFDPNSNKGVKYENYAGSVFFPRNQIVSGDRLTTKTGRYWTSSLCINDDSNYPYKTGYYFVVGSSNVKKGTMYRRDGLSLRPVKSASGPVPDPEPEPDRPKMNQGKSIADLPAWTDIDIDYSLLTATDHPRLFLFNNDFLSIRKLVSSNSNKYLRKLHDNIMGAAVIMARTTKPLEYTKDESGKRITQISRKAIHRIVDLAYAYRYTGEEKYLEMAEWNINVVCDFPDWNDEHFLDAAEMATAVGIGYDWLKKDLSDDTVEKVQRTLKEYALETGVNRNIFTQGGNWNQVCCGGLIVAALAIYETYPALADEVIRKAMASNAREVKNIYAPSGAFPEGPGYWEYGTTYEGILCLALETALGTDFEIPSVEGFQGAGDFYVFDRGNTGKRFNYSDSGENDETSFGLWYLAYKQKNPGFLYQDLSRLDDDTYLHEYYTFMAITASYLMGNVTATEPSGHMYVADNTSINPLMMCRTGWGKDDPYLALKGGSCNVSHAHMDAGEIVYEQYGTRWFKDFTYTTNYTELENIFAQMGMDHGDVWRCDDASPRWNVFQYHNRQHSTITVNDANHWPYGKARIYETFDSADELGAYVDLTDTFYKQLKSASRKAVISSGSYLEVTDNLAALDGSAAHIRWTCASDAAPVIVSDGIELSDGSTVMKLSTDATGATYRIWSVDPKDYETFLTGEDPLEGYLCGFEFDIPAGSAVKITTTLKKK